MLLGFDPLACVRFPVQFHEIPVGMQIVKYRGEFVNYLENMPCLELVFTMLHVMLQMEQGSPARPPQRSLDGRRR